MQTFFGEDETAEYCFVFMEDYNLILVFKRKSHSHYAHKYGGKTGEGYTVKVIRKNSNIILKCNCIGFRNHDHCKHVDFSTDEFDFNATKKPKTWIDKTNDEYIRMIMEGL